MVSQYTGVCEAASLIHDDGIGIGRHYHLYRLPDSYERLLLQCIRNEEFANQLLSHTANKEKALLRLKELGSDSHKKAEGPVVVGDFSDSNFEDLLKKIRGIYIQAFENEIRAYPFMRVTAA